MTLEDVIEGKDRTITALNTELGIKMAELAAKNRVLETAILAAWASGRRSCIILAFVLCMFFACTMFMLNAITHCQVQAFRGPPPGA